MHHINEIKMVILIKMKEAPDYWSFFHFSVMRQVLEVYKSKGLKRLFF